MIWLACALRFDTWSAATGPGGTTTVAVIAVTRDRPTIPAPTPASLRARHRRPGFVVGHFSAPVTIGKTSSRFCIDSATRGWLDSAHDDLSTRGSLHRRRRDDSQWDRSAPLSSSDWGSRVGAVRRLNHERSHHSSLVLSVRRGCNLTVDASGPLGDDHRSKQSAQGYVDWPTSHSTDRPWIGRSVRPILGQIGGPGTCARPLSNVPESRARRYH